ncbi:hypothetical protein MR818_11815 [bacterium]|nr:hypothetical protein [bacterium]
MKWNKKGKIYDHNTFNLEWYKKNSMVPLPYLKDDKTLRIYTTMCDEYNIGRIGYVDVNPENPSEILGYSKKPIINIGEDGHFDDNGVVTASLLKEDEKLYMFYSGYQSCVKVPYMIFTGLAVSYDNGDTFEKLTTDVPLLDRVKGEAGTRCVPYVIKNGDTYQMWYTSDYGKGWISTPNKLEPLYDMKYMESKDLFQWPSKGETAVTFKDDDEHGICKCTVWKEDDKYKVIYSIRHISKGYRLGYGEAEDGVHFKRMDELVGIDVSEAGFDDDMVCFAERIDCNGKVYLFYSGNHYGMEGIGYAELEEE